MVLGDIVDEPARLPPSFDLIGTSVHVEEETFTCGAIPTATVTTAALREHLEEKRCCGVILACLQ